MSVTYSAVHWNRNKRVYDLVIVTGVLLYLTIFFVIGRWMAPAAARISDEVLLLRALGTCALVMLHVVLSLGPLARLDRRFLPLVYNRRHLGVATFLVSLAHGVLATGYYHGFGTLHPLVSLLASNTNYGSLAAFPFEILGLAALAILFVLAATSHDFWQKNLGPSLWKGLHMLIYPAYALVVMHVALGALQTESSLLYPLLLGMGMTTVCGLHLATAWRERRRDVARQPAAVRAEDMDWLDVGCVDDLENDRAQIVALPGRERVAIFRYDGQISAVTNVCAHQRGPLGEGKIVDGCIMCPWHGWEYRPATGQSPPPFAERIATFRVRVVNRRIQLHPQPLPPGTPVEPARFEESCHVARH